MFPETGFKCEQSATVWTLVCLDFVMHAHMITVVLFKSKPFATDRTHIRVFFQVNAVCMRFQSRRWSECCITELAQENSRQWQVAWGRFSSRGPGMQVHRFSVSRPSWGATLGFPRDFREGSTISGPSGTVKAKHRAWKNTNFQSHIHLQYCIEPSTTYPSSIACKFLHGPSVTYNPHCTILQTSQSNLLKCFSP